MSRSALIDTVKVLASQLIVLHHLSLYAPMSDWLITAWPRLLAFISDDGRLAVQPFLVIGGFLTAQSLGQRRQAPRSPLPLIGQRYLRLAPQLAVALALVVVATALMGPQLAHEDWLSPLPTLGVFLAHLLFLQDVLGIDSLSAGAWYVAIDLQLFALFALLSGFTARADRPLAASIAPVLVALATAASIHLFSRQAALDVWALYFLAAYGLGALAAWAPEHRRARLCWWLVVALLLLDWALDPRARPLLSLATALLLWACAQRAWPPLQAGLRAPLRWLSDQSYSVFVCHFAVIIVASGLWEAFDGQGLGPAVGALALAWAASLALGAAVQRLCERWLPAPRSRVRTA